MNIETRIRLGEKIKSLREEQNLTQEKLAQMSGLGRTHYIEIEHGTLNVRMGTIEDIADSLGVTISDLFDGVHAKPEVEELVEVK